MKILPKFASPLVLAAVFALTGGFFAYAQKSESLTPSDQADVFEKTWNLVNDKYYDSNLNGVNWASIHEEYKPLIAGAKSEGEFYAILKRMVSEMKDAHTRFLTPREAAEFEAQKTTSAGLTLDEIENQTVVVRVLSGSDAERAGIKAGMIVRKIDDVPVAEKIAAIKENLGTSSSDRASRLLLNRRLLDGEPGTAVKISVTGQKGKTIEATLTRNVVSQAAKVTSMILPSGVAYISINRFFTPVAQLFKRELETVKDAPGLIIDLRYNGGGEIAEVMRIAGFLVNEKTSLGKVMFRGREPRDISFGESGKQIYSGPVVVLVNDASASGSELLASGLQEAGRAEIVGTRSCGCLLGIMNKRRMPGGGELHISEMGFLSAKGKIYEKLGITPDGAVELKIEDLGNGFDRDVAEAEKIIAKSARRQAD